MKRERLVILLGLLVALVFFYLGLNEWLKSREETVQPPPLVVKPAPAERAPSPPSKEKATPPPTPAPAEGAPQQEVKKETPKEKEPQQEKKQEDLIAQKIKEERKKTRQETTQERAPEKKELKTYTVQVGAFKDRTKAEKALDKAKSMGYQAKIVQEDNFYKVRLTLETDEIRSEMAKLKKVFGGAIIKQ